MTGIAIRIAPLITALALVLYPGTGEAKKRSVPGSRASLWIYLEAPSGEAERLRYRLGSLAALTEDGGAVPLELDFSEVSGTTSSGERLLARGSLPPDGYTGLLVEVESASLVDREGAAELLLPEAPTRVPVAFRVTRKGTVVLSLRLPFGRAVVEGHRFEPAFEAAVAPVSATGLTALAACRRSGTVSLFDKVSGRTFGVISVGGEPSSVVINRPLQQAYVSLAGESAIAVLDLQERDLLDRIPLGAGDEPVALALAPDGRTLLTANAGSGTVSFVDLGARNEIERVRVGERPEFLAIDPQGRRAYVINTVSNTVSIIDLGRRAVALTLSTEPDPIQGAFDRRGERFYVIHRSSPFILAVDTSQSAPPQRVYVGAGASAVTVDTRSDRVLVARPDRGEIEIYDPSSLLPVDAIPLRGRVSYLAVDLEENLLHAVLTRESRVAVLRLSNRRLVAEVEVGREPRWVALMGER